MGNSDVVDLVTDATLLATRLGSLTHGSAVPAVFLMVPLLRGAGVIQLPYILLSDAAQEPDTRFNTNPRKGSDMTDDKDRKILSDEEMEDVAGGTTAAEAILAAALDDGLSVSKKDGEQLVQLIDIRLETFRKG